LLLDECGWLPQDQTKTKRKKKIYQAFFKSNKISHVKIKIKNKIKVAFKIFAVKNYHCIIKKESFQIV